MHKNNLRIENHPVLGEYIKGKEVKITFDGKVITAYKGEMIATALIASGIKVFRYTPKKNMPRGLFCAILHLLRQDRQLGLLRLKAGEIIFYLKKGDNYGIQR